MYQSNIQKHILFNRQKFVSNSLKKVIDLINYAEINGVISFEDFCNFLKKEGLDTLEGQFWDIELNSPTLTSNYFKQLIILTIIECVIKVERFFLAIYALLMTTGDSGGEG